jgi:hypothetical protein
MYPLGLERVRVLRLNNRHILTTYQNLGRLCYNPFVLKGLRCGAYVIGTIVRFGTLDDA